MKKLLILIVLVFAGNPVFGQNPDRNAYKIRAQGAALVVTFEGQKYRLPTSAQIDAAKITETEILFAARKSDLTYLVIDVGGWSRAKQNDRQCGAGTEANLLWIKLDAAWKIVEINSVRYESCWSSISMGERRISQNLLEIEFDDFREDITVKVSYNADEPEKGFQIEQTALKENN